MVTGFNVGSAMSLEDMSLAIDYLMNKDAFELELQAIKNKISGKTDFEELDYSRVQDKIYKVKSL